MHRYTSVNSPDGRFHSWCENACRLYGELDYFNLSPMFSGSINGYKLGDLQLSSVNTSPVKVVCSKRQVEKLDENCLWVGFVRSGQALFHQQRETLSLRTGDLFFYSGGESYVYHIADHGEFLFIRIPHNLIQNHLTWRDYIPVQKISGAQGGGYIISSFLQAVIKEAELLRASDIEKLSVAFMNMLDMVLHKPGDQRSAIFSPHKITLFERIKKSIESQLHEEDLSPTEIAKFHGISHRYLNKIFKREGTTVARWIIDRRLELCCYALSSAEWNKYSISEIAYGHGFKNFSHFCKVFRTRYNCSPSEYRQSPK